MTTTVTPLSSYDVSSEVYPTGAVQRVKLVAGGPGDDEGPYSSLNPLPVSFNFGTNSVLPIVHSVGITVTACLSDNLSRKFLIIQNLSATGIDILFSVTGKLGEGYHLQQYETLEFNAVKLYWGPIYAIHGGAGTQSLLTIEG